MIMFYLPCFDMVDWIIQISRYHLQSSEFPLLLFDSKSLFDSLPYRWKIYLNYYFSIITVVWYFCGLTNYYRFILLTIHICSQHCTWLWTAVCYCCLCLVCISILLPRCCMKCSIRCISAIVCRTVWFLVRIFHKYSVLKSEHIFRVNIFYTIWHYHILLRLLYIRSWNTLLLIVICFPLYIFTLS